MKDTVDSRAVKIAAKIMQADGLCRQIVVLISVAEKPPKFIPGGFPFPQNVSQGFRQLHPHCTAPFRVCLLIMESLRIVRKQKSRRSRYQ